jgi:twinkle protein
MSKLKQFAVENNVSLSLVAHQITPRKDETGRYPRPDVNYIKGGSEFANKADNVLMVWRPNRAIDFKDKRVIFGSQKIKKQKLVGIPQEIGDIEFNRNEHRYYFNGFTPFTNLDEQRTRKSSSVISPTLHNQSEQQEEVVNIE